MCTLCMQFVSLVWPIDAWECGMYIFLHRNSLITRICLKPQKSMLKSWDSCAVWTWLLAWQSLSGPLFVCMMLHGIALQPCLIISLMLLFLKTLHATMTLWQCYDIQKFDADTILFWKIQCKKRHALMFKQHLQCYLGQNQVNYARITIIHVCFIALRLAGSLRRCLSTRPNGLMFKQLSLDPANVRAKIFLLVDLRTLLL